MPSKTSKTRKSKTRKQTRKPTKARPPRIFIKKGKLYVRVGKKNFLLKDQQDYTKRELIDIILKELVIRRKGRKRGTVTKRERKKDKDEMKVFHEFEKLNNSQSKYLKLPTNFNQKSQAAQSVFTGLIKSFTSLPGDVNLETRLKIKKDADELKKTQLVKSKTKPKTITKVITRKLKPKTKPSITTAPTSTSTSTSTPKGMIPPLASMPTLVPYSPRRSIPSSKKITKTRSKRKGEIRKEIDRFGYSKAKKKFKDFMAAEGGPDVKTKSKDELTELIHDYYENDTRLGELDGYLSRQQLFDRPALDLPPPLDSEADDEAGDILQSDFGGETDVDGDPIDAPDAPDSKVTASRQAVINMTADGAFYTGKGLKTSEIDKMMSDIPGFIGTFPSDFYKFLPKKLPKKFGFVMNLDKSDKPGSHWVAVYIDAENDMSIEYYDSFAMPPPKGFMKQIKRVVDKLNPNVYLKFKVNGIVDQKSTTSNCGWHCMNFLLKRFMDKPFKTVTKYDAVNGEDEVQTLKEKFGYI